MCCEIPPEPFPDTRPVNNTFILGMADWAGVKKPVVASMDKVSRTPLVTRVQRNSEGDYLLFLINHGASDVRPRVTLPVDEAGSYRIRELITGERSLQTARGSGDKNELRLDPVVPGRDVRIMHIDLRTF